MAWTWDLQITSPGELSLLFRPHTVGIIHHDAFRFKLTAHDIPQPLIFIYSGIRTMDRTANRLGIPQSSVIVFLSWHMYIYFCKET